MDAFDANMLIYAATGNPLGRDVARLIGGSGSLVPAIGSVILITEVFGRAADVVDAIEEQRLVEILGNLELKGVDRDTAELAATMRSKYRLRTPDAIHLATAVRWGADRFHTNNSNDFDRYFDEIEIVLPQD